MERIKLDISNMGHSLVNHMESTEKINEKGTENKPVSMISPVQSDYLWRWSGGQESEHRLQFCAYQQTLTTLLVGHLFISSKINDDAKTYQWTVHSQVQHTLPLYFTGSDNKLWQTNHITNRLYTQFSCASKCLNNILSH